MRKYPFLAHLLFYITSLIAGMFVLIFCSAVYEIIIGGENIVTCLSGAALAVLLCCTYIYVPILYTIIPYSIIAIFLKTMQSYNITKPRLIYYMIGGGITAGYLPCFILINGVLIGRTSQGMFLFFLLFFFSGLCAGYIYHRLEFRKKLNIIEI